MTNGQRQLLRKMVAEEDWLVQWRSSCMTPPSPIFDGHQLNWGWFINSEQLLPLLGFSLSQYCSPETIRRSPPVKTHQPMLFTIAQVKGISQTCIAMHALSASEVDLCVCSEIVAPPKKSRSGVSVGSIKITDTAFMDGSKSKKIKKKHVPWWAVNFNDLE